ncbi:MAG: hypothetical protein HZB56_20400 [Deltaproteobacteria bacterium]|nr:hypothetical protein [Deltaproteobacteria bacterium]
MPPSTAAPTYRAFLASRWPIRTRGLALHAIAGTFALALLDWVFARALGLPLGAGTIAAVRLPWSIVPVLGYLFLLVAPGARLLPAAVIGLCLTWAWGNSWAYLALGLDGTVLHAVARLAWLVTVASFLPVSVRLRALVFALMWLGHPVLSLFVRPASPLAVRLAAELVVVAFAVIQILVFQRYAASQRRGILLRRRLEQAVVELDVSRQRAADAVAQVGRMAANVAHDVNNPLSAVKVNVRWLASESAVSEPPAERAEVAADTLQAVERIARIVAELKQRATEHEEKVHREQPSEETTSIRRLAGDSESR